jgi:hypothetical protein
MSDEPLGLTGVPVPSSTRWEGWRLLNPAAGDCPSRWECEAIFAQEPPTFPPGNPSMGSRPYHYGDPVSSAEVVLRNWQTGEMVVVYPGSQEAAAHPWPDWLQVYVG